MKAFLVWWFLVSFVFDAAIDLLWLGAQAVPVVTSGGLAAAVAANTIKAIGAAYLLTKVWDQ